MLRVSLIALLFAAGLRADEPAKPLALRDYLPTLLLKIQADTAREYVAALELLHKLSESLGDAGLVPAAQVRQAEREFLQSRIDALQRERDHADSLDQFQARYQAKPERLRELEDAAVLPLQRHLRKFEDVLKGLDALGKDFSKRDDPDDAHKLRAALSRIVKSATMFDDTRFRSQFTIRWVALEKQTGKELIQLLHDKGEERRKLAADKAELEEKGKTLGPESRRLMMSAELDIDLARFEGVLRRYESEPWKGAQDAGQRHAEAFRTVGNAFATVLLRGCAERLDQLRSSWPEVPPLLVEKVDLLAGDREQAERAVTRAIKSPETAAAAKAKLRRLRSLAEMVRIGQRLIELALIQRQDDLDNLRSPAAGNTDANGPLTQMLATEKSVSREKGQLLRVWVEIQIARLELESDLGIAGP